jgi:hypothetical protein
MFENYCLFFFFFLSHRAIKGQLAEGASENPEPFQVASDARALKM